LDFGSSIIKKQAYNKLARIKWLNKITDLIISSKGSIYGMMYFIRDGDFTGLKVLDLSTCKISDTVIKYITIYGHLWSLESITIQNPGITHKGARYIAQSRILGNLRMISGVDAGFGGDLGLKCLAESRYLNKLEGINMFDNTLITDQGVEYLGNGRLRGLTEINLEGCNIGDEAFKILSNSEVFTKLKLLNLSRTKITHKGLEEYANSNVLKEIEILYLNECEIGDLGIDHLKNSENTKSIRYLYLVSCGLTVNMISILKNHEAFKNLKGHKWGPFTTMDAMGKNYLAM
jgi:hypothetical protein